MSERFICRPAETIEDMRRIVGLLGEMQREARAAGEGLVSKVDADYARGAEEIGRVIREGAAFIVEDAETRLVVGSLGLWRRDGFWFAPDAEHFAELWFYVVKALRHGEPTTLLLEEAQGLADATDTPVYLNLFDPHKAAKKRPGPVAIGQRLGYFPMGRITRFYPSAGREQVGA